MERHVIGYHTIVCSPCVRESIDRREIQGGFELLFVGGFH